MSAILKSRPITPHIPILPGCPSCTVLLEFPTPSPPPVPGTSLRVKCFSCHSIITYVVPSSKEAHSSGGRGPQAIEEDQNRTQRTTTGRKGRKIGTQENPLETGYYDILGVPINATTDDIKKAYRRLAIKHHPDKNRNDPQAEERFKLIAIAYQTLSDETLRKKYNEFGPKESAPEGGYVDPEEVFGVIFGGERFTPIIGHISIGRDLKTALQEAEEAEHVAEGKKVARDSRGREILSEEEKTKKDEKARKVAAEKAAIRTERVQSLVAELSRKLSIFTESATGPHDPDVSSSWRTICQLEANELKRESYGVELLHTIGFVYTSKARHYFASNQTFLGVGAWLHNVRGGYHVFSETVSTVRAAVELKAVFDQIQAAEKAGNLPPEEKKRLEEQAAEKGLQALFKSAKLEVESVLRETCDRVLNDPSISLNKAELRAVALQILGEAYMSVRKDRGDAEEDFVNVEPRNSRENSSCCQHDIPSADQFNVPAVVCYNDTISMARWSSDSGGLAVHTSRLGKGTFESLGNFEHYTVRKTRTQDCDRKWHPILGEPRWTRDSC